MTRGQLILTVDDLEAVLKVHGARQWKMYMLGNDGIRVLVNMYSYPAPDLKYTQQIIDQLRPVGFKIELVEVEEFLN